jgi:glutaconyl-CoA/methylmalonyl-CoA decarboxylase subunit gamma
MKKFNFKINNHSYAVGIVDVDSNIATVDVNGILYEVEVEQELKPAKSKLPRKDFVPSADLLPPVKTYAAENSSGIIRSPLPGKVIDIAVNLGDKVTIGQTVICIEAMKMENNIRTDRDGIVKRIRVQTDDVVIEGRLLMEIE